LEGDVIRQQIAQRSAKLVAIARELKSELFGIDDVIDRVIESVRAWYVLPQIITRPVIICLWGLTGTGKTQLTRSLAQKLDFYSRFVEVQMDGFSNDSGRRSQSISGMLAETIEQGEAGILVLDEFQRFRTVDAQGKDVKVERYMDVWALLSDGRLAPALSFMQDLQMTLADAQYREDRQTSRRASAASNPFAHSAFADGHAFDEDDDEEVQDGAAPFEAGEPVRLPLPAVPKFRLSPYEAKEFKNTLKLKEPLTDIMSWSSELVMQRLQAFCNDPSAWETDYSKLLIFICGNLDEMYTDLATRVEDCDTDADIFHAMTTQLSVIDVKRALMHRFKPEQIARLGNCHIIYPSFSRATFEKLVVSAAEQHLAGVRTTSGLQFSLSPDLLDQLYESQQDRLSWLLAHNADPNTESLDGVFGPYGGKTGFLGFGNQFARWVGRSETSLTGRNAIGWLNQFLDAGANVKAVTNDQSSFLHLYAGEAFNWQFNVQNAEESLKALIARGADINALDNAGYTPLMRGLIGGYNGRRHCPLDQVKQFLALGADTGITALDGKRAFDIAIESAAAGDQRCNALLPLLKSQ